MLRWDMAFDPYQLIDKKTRKALTRRNDRIGLMHLGGHFAAIGVGGYAVFLTYGTIFMLPAMWLHGIVLACLFAPMHECSHGTAFPTLILWVCTATPNCPVCGSRATML
jgi:fatty acid desaturase